MLLMNTIRPSQPRNATPGSTAATPGNTASLNRRDFLGRLLAATATTAAAITPGCSLFETEESKLDRAAASALKRFNIDPKNIAFAIQNDGIGIAIGIKDRSKEGNNLSILLVDPKKPEDAKFLKNTRVFNNPEIDSHFLIVFNKSGNEVPLKPPTEYCKTDANPKDTVLITAMGMDHPMNFVKATETDYADSANSLKRLIADSDAIATDKTHARSIFAGAEGSTDGALADLMKQSAADAQRYREELDLLLASEAQRASIPELRIGEIAKSTGSTPIKFSPKRRLGFNFPAEIKTDRFIPGNPNFTRN